MKRIGLFIFIAVMLALTVWLTRYFYLNNKKSPIVYQTTKPFVMDIVKKTVATGSIGPRKEINIKPQISGVVEVLFVEAGQQVKKGEPVARIKLVPSPININNAESSVELARIRLRDAKRELARQQQMNSGGQDIEQAKINAADAAKELKRQKELYDDGVISEQAYNQFVVAKDLADSRLENTMIDAQRTLKQFETDVDIRKQELDAAINNLQLLKEGASKKSKQISNIVTSTVSGMVLEVPVEEGSSVIERNNFNEGTTIAVVADMKSLLFVGKVDESDVGKLKTGMPLKLTVGALEDVSFDATLEFIAPKGMTEDGTVKFEIKAAVQPRSDIFLRAGYSASADIILASRNNTLAVKERDLTFAGDSVFVEIETGEQQFEKKLIKTGISDGINIEVLGGVDSTQVIKMKIGE